MACSALAPITCTGPDVQQTPSTHCHWGYAGWHNQPRRSLVSKLSRNPAAHTRELGIWGCYQSIGMGQPSPSARTRQRDARLQATCKPPQGLNRPRWRPTPIPAELAEAGQKQHAQRASDRAVATAPTTLHHVSRSPRCLGASLQEALNATKPCEDWGAHVPAQPRACFGQIRHHCQTHAACHAIISAASPAPGPTLGQTY